MKLDIFQEEEEVFNLTVQSVKDFQVCERYFSYEYIEKEYHMVIGRELLAQRFQNTLKRIATFFFYKQQGGFIPSYNSLINRWERLWFPKDIDSYELAVQQREIAHHNLASYSNVAVENLIKFHEDFSNLTEEIYLLDEDFIVPIEAQLRLTGTIDLVLKAKNHYRIIKWGTQLKRLSAASLMFDFAALKMAFEYRNNTPMPNVDFFLYDLASNQPGLIEIPVNNKHVDEFKFWLQTPAHTKHYIPRRGYTVYCRGCPFDDQCKEWDQWPKQ